MLKKLLTGCLTIAMIGAFSASASAETTFTWSGDVSATLKQVTDQGVDATGDQADAVTTMDMAATGDLDLTIVKSGDTWTGTAYLDFDFNSDYSDGGQSLGIDDVYVKMSNDTMAISFGEFDPVGIGKGGANLGEIDDTYGAGELGKTPGEQGWLMLSLTDVGLDLFIGMNENKEGPATGTDSTADDGLYSSTAFGAKFDKTFGDLALALEYVGYSTKRNEDQSGAVAEDSKWDAASGSEIDLAVQYTMGEMAFAFNYGNASFTAGGDAEAETITTMELIFDMAISDTQGLTVEYGMKSTKQDGTPEVDTADTVMNITFKMATGAVDHYVAYQATTNTLKDADNSTKQSVFGYTMRVAF